MNQSFAGPILIAGALSMMGVPGGGIGNAIPVGHAAPWIAPAPQQELSAQWVEDVARELRDPRFRNIFMNIPGGSPQATILDLLNEAAVGLKNGEPEYARHLVRKAVNVLDRSAGQGWYSESDVQPIQAMILRHAKQGFSEADQKFNPRNRNKQRNDMNSSSSRTGEGGVRLFNPEKPNYSGDRWDGYTSDHWQGSGQSYDRGQNKNIRQNNSQHENDRFGDRARGRSFRDKNQKDMETRDDSSGRERGGTQRYYSDEFYYSDYPYQDRGQRVQGDGQGRNNRMNQRDHQGSNRDQMPWSMKQDRSQHARGNARFYQERQEDRGQERPYDRGPGQDQYFESTTREHSRGYNQ